jgi:protein SCO1
MSRNATLAFAALLALVLALVAATAFQQRQPGIGAELQAGTALPEPRPLPDFRLVDQHGGTLERAALQGRWTLVFTGFTHCPDICPATLALLAAVETRLREAGVPLQVLFLSVDPKRDTPGHLAAYVGHFNPAFVGATGAPAEIDRLVAGLGFAYLEVPLGGENYTIDHSTALALVNPRGEVAAYFTAPLQVDALVADLAATIGDQR